MNQVTSCPCIIMSQVLMRSYLMTTSTISQTKVMMSVFEAMNRKSHIESQGEAGVQKAALTTGTGSLER